MAAAIPHQLTVAVTGASGFVGRTLVRRLGAMEGITCRACYRSAPSAPPPGCDVQVTGDLLDGEGWGPALAGADAVVHTAARAHVMQETAADALAAYRRMNVEGTLSIAGAAAEAGVRRFVFLSTAKVNGEGTPIDSPFTEDDPPAPQDPYAVSKLEAEQGLWAIQRMTGMAVVVLRPPLVIGPDAKGNIARLRRWITRGLPLPLGAIANLRSVISLDSLCDVIAAALVREAAANQTYLVADADLSTPDLVRQLADELGRPAHLIPVPTGILRLAGRLARRDAEVDRLVGSFRVDASRAQRDLGLGGPASG